MYDVSGEGWIKHILYGTSKMLQARGPDEHVSEPGRSFFLTVRVFEVCRALIYAEPTFLSEERWKLIMLKLWATSSHDWHPKESILDLMIDCTALRFRYVAFSSGVHMFLLYVNLNCSAACMLLSSSAKT
jgi:hypothetical protein